MDDVKFLMDDFFVRHVNLAHLRLQISEASNALSDCFTHAGKLLVCGNGGSAADSGHIVGELMKGFFKKRPLPESWKKRFTEQFSDTGKKLADTLQMPLPAIALGSQLPLASAFSNDVNANMEYAQEAFAYAQEGDILLGISTSGNSENICHAVRAAKVKKARTICLTGRGGGQLAGLCDISIISPEQETYRIQEDHLAIYHLLCRAVELHFFTK
ncbi:D-sedoheptulose-7-phosphate isomerase [Parasphaerochaeta coccoides]|uniref:Sugar isomerase (SIS) n=1 Tax=Parasphaerochaeta coccoides (strain ATCC BAA-1237 / DSM 17374 / SPN1) TaxID=760011 RepID=F4GJS5_PARC1|nr:SIS domain-containing protein [Parasphaerochaeta coccoides]AEC02822.1 sugar isomerase (SIS) [Parasphaerochaeta coccoides DSM 17374]